MTSKGLQRIGRLAVIVAQKQVSYSVIQRIVKAYERYNELVGPGRQLALRLGSDAPVEPAPEPPANTKVEIPDVPSFA